jgi:PAT family beta-lactamase induction signal transducer AmpG
VNHLDVALAPLAKAQADSLLKFVKQTNLDNGFVRNEVTVSADSTWWERSIGLWWTNSVSKPLGKFLRETFNPNTQAVTTKGNIGIVAISLREKPRDDQYVVVRVERESGGEDILVQEGQRLEFHPSNWNKNALVAFQVDPKLRTSSATMFKTSAGNIPLAWSVTFGILAVLFALFFIYHRFILPRPASDKPVMGSNSHNPLREFVRVFALFFKKKNIWVILAFLLLYRFAEAQLVKLVSPFLLDAREKGGLGLTTSELGIVYGTVGIIALTLGGLLGGYVASRRGLKFWLWPMVLAIHLPDAMFIYLSHLQPTNFFLINAAVAIEQFGYGFGFTAYMLFMIMISEGEHKTAHYAICTGFMALGMMLPGMFSGWLQEQVGYARFFEWVLLSTIPGFIVAALVKIEPEFGKKKAAA